MKISILGNQATVSLIKHITDERIVLSYYQSKSSIISLLSDSLKIPITDFSLDDWTEKRFLYTDINKNFFEYIRETKSDFLIIDLLEEHFQIFKVGKSYVTKSNLLTKSGMIDQLGGKLLSNNERDEIWKTAFIKFAKLTSLFFSQEKIIIHKAYFKEKYIDENGNIQEFSKKRINAIRIINERLNKYYDYLESMLPNAWIIEFENEEFFAEKRDNMVSPTSYEERYYVELLKHVEKIIFGENREVKNEKV